MKIFRTIVTSCVFFFIFGFFGLAQASGSSPEKPIVVVIASYNNRDWYKRNLDSVFSQNYSNYRVVYVDDRSPDGTGDLVESYVTECDQWHRFTFVKNKVRKLKMANTYMAYHKHCRDEEIVVELDGDDWLAHNEVFSKINNIYSKSDVWMTYGHFMEWPTGRLTSKLGLIRAIPQAAIDERRVRKLPGCMWAGLRTYYAWLVKQVKLEDLLYKGTFLPYTSDAAIMFPMFDMAGNHFAFITDDIWLQHNVKTPINDHKVDQQGTAGLICRIMRNKPSYNRLNKSRIGFLESFDDSKADVIVLAGNDQQKINRLLYSIERHVCGVGQVFVIKALKDIDRMLATSENDHVLFITDEYAFIQDVNLNECIKNIEETGAHGFFLGLGKHVDHIPAHVHAVGTSYAWQFKQGTGAWKKPKSRAGVLYRKSSVAKSSGTGQDVDKVGLFFGIPSIIRAQYFDLGSQVQYQDIIINSEVVSQGDRLCATRYKAIKKVLDKYTRPITVLDIGASQGYFSFRIAKDYDSVCVMIEGSAEKTACQLFDLCRLNTELDNIIFLNKAVTVADLKALSLCEHFDVVLLFNVAHHVPQSKQFIDAVLTLGDNIIIETPPASDRSFGGSGHIASIENHVMSKGGTVLAETPRHNDPTAKAKMVWIQRKKTVLSKAYWLYPAVRLGCWAIDSSFDHKRFIKNRDGVSRITEWIPGINLLTFKMLNGVFPDGPYIKERLAEVKLIPHADGFLWNMILQGRGLTPIDVDDKEPKKPFDPEKVFHYNMVLIDINNSREIACYVKDVNHRISTCK